MNPKKRRTPDMATVVTCDLCGAVIKGPVVRILAVQGEHPEKSEPLRRRVDACPKCLSTINDLSTEKSVDNLKQASSES